MADDLLSSIYTESPLEPVRHKHILLLMQEFLNRDPLNSENEQELVIQDVKFSNMYVKTLAFLAKKM